MKRTLTLSVALVVLPACGSGRPENRSVRSGSDTPAELGEVRVRGFPVEVRTRRCVGNVCDVRGELLAADPNGVDVLDSSGTVCHVPREEVKNVAVTLRSVPGESKVAVWVWLVLGSASAVSHGYLAVGSGPAWVAVGVPAAVYGTMAHTTTGAAPEHVGKLAQYARFPQGLPPGFMRP